MTIVEKVHKNWIDSKSNWENIADMYKEILLYYVISDKKDELEFDEAEVIKNILTQLSKLMHQSKYFDPSEYENINKILSSSNVEDLKFCYMILEERFLSIVLPKSNITDKKVKPYMEEKDLKNDE